MRLGPLLTGVAMLDRLVHCLAIHLDTPDWYRLSEHRRRSG